MILPHPSALLTFYATFFVSFFSDLSTCDILFAVCPYGGSFVNQVLIEDTASMTGIYIIVCIYSI